MFNDESESPQYIKRQIVEHQWPVVEKGKKRIFPAFLSLPHLSTMDALDLVFYETALPAIAAFISEAARLGGGDPPSVSSAVISTPSVTTSGEVLSSLCVLKSLCATSTADMVPSSARNLTGEFPCKQTVRSALGDVEVSVEVQKEVILFFFFAVMCYGMCYAKIKQLRVRLLHIHRYF
jgi:hypothetical protein